jgi:hypothetical protein
MKVCPKCHSKYSDETLNFCLTDGAPLSVGEGVSGGFSASNSWQDAETLQDSRFFAAESAHRTSPNSSAPTMPMINAKTETLPRPQNSSNSKLFTAVGALVFVALLGGGYWYYSGNNSNANAFTANASENTVQTSRAIVPLNDEQSAKVKKEVADFIESWRKTNEDREIDRHIDHYANTLENFYKESGISKNHVRADRQRAYEIYDSLSLQVDNLKITPESETSAVAVFDKSWTFKNEKKTSTGSVEQEIRAAKQNGKWLIVGEKDVMVHFINNRVNPEANQASGDQNAPAQNPANK